jgi:Zn-dependent M28 family amino/carboxypeptidase
MIGGHLDSWHGGTGATDNGTGSSVAIEAMRILKALNVTMDRTFASDSGAAKSRACSGPSRM